MQQKSSLPRKPVRRALPSSPLALKHEESEFYGYADEDSQIAARQSIQALQQQIERQQQQPDVFYSADRLSVELCGRREEIKRFKEQNAQLQARIEAERERYADERRARFHQNDLLSCSYFDFQAREIATKSRQKMLGSATCALERQLKDSTQKAAELEAALQGLQNKESSNARRIGELEEAIRALRQRSLGGIYTGNVPKNKSGALSQPTEQCDAASLNCGCQLLNFRAGQIRRETEAKQTTLQNAEQRLRQQNDILQGLERERGAETQKFYTQLQAQREQAESLRNAYAFLGRWALARSELATSSADVSDSTRQLVLGRAGRAVEVAFLRETAKINADLPMSELARLLR